MKLAIVDLDYGNIASIRHAFARLGVEADVTADPDALRAAERIVLPGVGAAGHAMARLRERDLIDTIRTLTQPALGICLGMQLLFEASDESDTECLGLVPGRVRALRPADNRPVPHMGWSALSLTDDSIGLAPGDYVYFAHSFACPDGEATVARAQYEEPIPAAIAHENWWAAQFHPERSGAAGARYLQAFLEWQS